MQHGFDYIPNMVSPIDSYIARGAGVFFADDSRPKMVFDICQHVFSRVRDGCNHEIASACKLLQSFVLVGRGRGAVAAKWSQLAVVMAADLIPKVSLFIYRYISCESC